MSLSTNLYEDQVSFRSQSTWGPQKIVNVQNTYEKCFQWAILSALHPTRRHAQRISKYTQYVEELYFSGIDSRCKWRTYQNLKIKMKSQLTSSVMRRTKFTPYTWQRNASCAMLIFWSYPAEIDHTNFNRLMNNGQHDNQKFYCCFCLHGFWKKRLLNIHMPYCQTHGAQRTEMLSEEKKWLNYSDVSKQLKVPFVVYADFERCIAEAISTCQPNICKSSITSISSGWQMLYLYARVRFRPSSWPLSCYWKV